MIASNEFRMYYWYRRGFSSGASGQRKVLPGFMPEDVTPVWLHGYAEGVHARKRALLRAMKALQYKPFRLRGSPPRRKNPKQIQLPMRLSESVKVS